MNSYARVVSTQAYNALACWRAHTQANTDPAVAAATLGASTPLLHLSAILPVPGQGRGPAWYVEREAEAETETEAETERGTGTETRTRTRTGTGKETETGIETR